MIFYNEKSSLKNINKYLKFEFLDILKINNYLNK